MRKVTSINAADGKDPMGLAATVLYIASQSHGDRNKSQRYFADIAGVSDVTIKNRIQEKYLAYSCINEEGRKFLI